jgi:uncharacterized membrane protein YphA (DoxX/SURF4 family)
VALWVVKLLVGAAFLYAAVMKLSGDPHMVAEFEKIGLGQGFRILTGVVELTGALMLLAPRTTFAGAVVLTGISVGALIAQLGPLKGDLIHVFVLGGLVLLIGWASRPAMLR